MDTEYAPVVGSDEDEEERKRRYPLLPPVESDAPQPGVRPAPDLDKAVPAAISASPSPARGGGDIFGSEQTRGPSLRTAVDNTLGPRPDPKNYQPVEHHGLRRGLDIAGGLLGGAEGRKEIFQAPRDRARQQYEDASKAYDTQHSQLMTEQTHEENQPLRMAQATEANARAASQELTEVTIPGQTEPIMIPKKDVGRFQQAIATNSSKEGIADKGNQTKEDIASEGNKTKKDIADAGNKTKEDIADKNNATKKVVEQMRDNFRALQQNRKDKQLTSATRTMIESVPAVRHFVDRLNSLSDDLKDEIGPGSSRWHDLWTGKVGTDNPAWKRLQADMTLLETRLMRMHVGARGGTDILHHFHSLLNDGKMSFNDFKAALDEIKQYADEVETEGNIDKTSGPSGGSSATAKPAGGDGKSNSNMVWDMVSGTYKPKGKAK